MPIIKPQGLKGLQGVGALSQRDYDAFVERNNDLIAKHNYDPAYISNLYSNKQFIDRYGVDQFKAIPDFDTRNNLFREDVVNEEWDNLYGGMPDQWKQKYGLMSTDAKQKLLESDWLNPTEFDQKWNSYLEEVGNKQKAFDNSGAGAFMPLGASIGHGMLSTSTGSGTADFLAATGSAEGAKQRLSAENDKILEHIYNDDVDAYASQLSDAVSAAYQDPALLNMSDEQVKKAFVQAITPGSYEDNMGIAEYASHYGNGTDGEITSEMKEFSVDDMRQVLAKKQVYEQYMSPEMATTALNNDAKRYIKNHQSQWKRFGLFAKDVGISAMSYTADKVNGIYNLGLIAADQFGDKPVVWVDDTGNVVDSNAVAGGNGQYVTIGKDGQMHPVHQMEIDRTTLHNMGKNFDGSENDGILNPQYWTKAEQFGTLDEDLQNKYEQLGSSPYKVAYDPNEDSDLMYESFKMMSFGLADGAAQFIPFGIGMIGKTLSTASKIGRIGRGLGEAMNWSGKMLTAQSRAGQYIQGGAGALGIAYAYNRGAFQETLQQNLANAEEVALNRSKQEIYDEYQTNEQYKVQMDTLIDAKAASIKSDYMAKLGAEGQGKVVDEEKLDEMFHARAQQIVMGEAVQQRLKEMKNSDEYAVLEEEAINSAGDAAVTTFLPEAVKYGLVNTVGFRKWMYSNPTGLKNKVAAGLEGIKEITTPAGKQRLVAETSKFLTNGQKWKAMGKAAGSQIWGGAWTNGTDDMMVDAAERINEDSFKRYLDAYENGEAMADTYGFADGLYSYWKGLNNSMGQETTLNAATVGGLGSVLSFTPNMANIAHLATKEGRQMYKNNFQQRYKRNEDGLVMRDEQGNPVYEDINWKENWRGRLDYFVQNGVLNTYYGAKQTERDMQNHADYVNMLLDDYDDFKVIEELVTSDIALDNAETVGDQKTMRFVKAISTLNALDKLAQNPNDPTTLSSVVQNAQEFIRKAANMQMEGEDAFTEDEMSNMLSQYYAQNPGIPQSEANNQIALYQISKNAQKLQEASEAYDKAEKEIQKIEKQTGKPIDPAVRAKMKMDQALDGHWKERIETMRQEIDDVSDADGEVSVEDLIPSVGGKKNAEALVKVYEKQQAEIKKELEDQQQKTQQQKDALDIAKASSKAAKTSEEKYNTQKTQEEAQAKYDDALQQEDYLKGLISRTEEKKLKIEQAIGQFNQEGSTIADKVLTAEEIFALDPVTRARMMNQDNRQLYSEAQQKEISKLEQRLLMRDADALIKVQDIAKLTQRVRQNEDAYSRMAKNPEAAAVQLEAQRQQEADAAYKLINQRNAETVADFVREFDEGMQGHGEISQGTKDEFVFRTLRKMSPTLLDIIEEDQLLPQYQKQVQDAKEWGKTVADIDAVISQAEENQAWKDNVSRAIEGIVENANDRDGILANLEKAIDDTDSSQTAQDFEKVLNAMEQLGYQRDATTIENRKQRREREVAEAQRKKEAEEDAKIAAAEAAAKAAEEANAQPAQEVKPDGSNLANPFEVAPIDQSEEAAEQKGELSEPLDLNEPVVIKPDYHSSMKGQIGDKQSKWDYYTENDKNTRDTKDGKVILGVALQGTLQPAINYAVDAGILEEEHRIKDTNASIENSNKVREAIKALQDLGIKSPSQLINYVENNEGKNVSHNKETNSSVNNSVEASHIIDNGDSVQGKSATIDEQIAEGQNEGKEVHSSEDVQDVAAANGTGEHVIETSANTLSGNAMSEYKAEPLKKEGILEHKQGANPIDSMSRYYAWMDAAGIKLQNIIDQELAQILKLTPEAKVKFMVVRPENNATHDNDMKTHLLLVLDYDNSINKDITSIHNTENGGVLESNGKQYLVIGTMGYGNKNAGKLALYDILFSNNPRSTNGYGLVKRGQGEFFRTHPEERFYVPENLSTEVVPMSLIPGYIVRQLESDENPQYRSVRELLNDPMRNPMGLEMQDLAWGIQERLKFLVLGTNSANVMIPRNPDANNGSAFVLIPASNGKLVPSYLKPLFYNEMKDGQLKDRVQDLLNDVTSPDYNTRLQAVIGLSNIFYMDKEGDTILLMKSKNVVSLVKDGKTFKTFVLDENFDRMAFMEAVAEMNPRVNITKSVLQSPILLQQYDEAGALETDAAQLATAGSSYSIYGVDANGQMLKPEVVNNDIPRTEYNSAFRNGGRGQVVFKHQYYTFDRESGNYYLNGVPVIDANTVKGLEVNRRIIEGGLSAIENDGVWGTYILSEGEHPEVVKVHRNTKEVQSLSEEDAQKFIDKLNKQKAEEARAEAAKQALETQKVEDVELGEEGLVVDDVTGELLTPAELKQRQEARQIEKEKIEGEEAATVQQPSGEVDKLHKSGAQLEADSEQGAAQNFSTLAKSRNWRKQVRDVLKTKWPDAPTNMAELEAFLRSKNVEVDAIGTSDAAVQAWLDTIINCR